MTTPEPVLLTVLVEYADGAIAAGTSYEDTVLGLLGKHGGTLERRLRTADSRTELHVILFSSRDGYDSFMVDPERLALRAVLGDAAPTTRVHEMAEVQTGPQSQLPGASGSAPR